ncbi:hypothetical protein D3Z48_07350 [Clostridiaceae bacterium]|nr:hypothetical protein [Clostridiaceae bacterium]
MSIEFSACGAARGAQRAGKLPVWGIGRGKAGLPGAGFPLNFKDLLNLMKMGLVFDDSVVK